MRRAGAIVPVATLSRSDAGGELAAHRTHDLGLNVVLRIYVPDLEKVKNWRPPKAAKVVGS